VNVLFVNYHHFRSNSAVHIFNLANELVGLGVDAAVPNHVETVKRIGQPRFLCGDRVRIVLVVDLEQRARDRVCLVCG
jgi:hypothetical protein